MSNDFLKKIENGNKDNEVVDEIKSFFNPSQENIRRFKKKLKKDKSNVNQRKSKNVYCTELVDDDNVYLYMNAMSDYVQYRMNKEYESTRKNLYDEELRKKFKFFTETEEKEFKSQGKKVPKVTEQDAEQYNKLIYPNINIALFEQEFENGLLTILQE